jgi:NADPH-dependent ferric siderophore reductase
LDVGGPRGSNVVADDFDWYLLIGDETALPAIGRWVEELRPDAPVTTVVVIDSEAERQRFSSRAAWTPIWVMRDGLGTDDATLLSQALDQLPTAPGDGYVWIAAEALVARALRAHVIDGRGHPKAWVKASGYWSRGAAAVHEAVED